MNESTIKLYGKAYMLSLSTIFFNILEGIVSLMMGIKSETLTLSGFGIDSFIEIISAAGIAVMTRNILNNNENHRSSFEKNALKITGASFYLLSAGLLAGIIVSIAGHYKPETTVPGIIISLVSIVAMTWLLTAKRRTGRRLGSEPVMTDANCTLICIYMSLVLLLSSIIYEITGFVYSDSIGAAGLIYFSLREAHEAFEKSKTERFNEGNLQPNKN